MSNLTLRVLSALVLTSVAILCIGWNHWTRTGILATFLLLAAWELGRMVDTKFGAPSLAWLTTLLTALLIAPNLVHPSMAHAYPTTLWTQTSIILTVSALILVGFRYLSITSMAPWMTLQIIGCLYIGFWSASVFGLLDPVSGLRAGFPLLFVIFAVAFNDTGGYFVGRAAGKRKLSPEISPKKTWEGAIGGLLTTALFALLAGPWMLQLNWLSSLGLGVLLAATGTLGDLVESTLKRYTGFKDSSQIIPGHGGVLDRFDSLFFSAPFAVLYLELFRG